jgi:hypothetical protein
MMFTKSACTAQSEKLTNPVNGSNYIECDKYREEVRKRIELVKPEIVIISGLSANTNPESLSKTLTWIHEVSPTTNVVYLGDTPFYSTDHPHHTNEAIKCLSKNKNNIQTCSIDRATIERRSKIGEISKILKTNNEESILINPADWFCGREKCPMFINNIVVYFNGNHISKSYAEYLTPLLEEALLPALNMFADKQMDARTKSKSEITPVANLQTLQKQISDAALLRQLPDNLSVNLLDTRKNINKGCIHDNYASTPNRKQTCILGDTQSKQKIVLFGDSHAYQWLPAFEYFALHNKYQLIIYTKNGCPPFDVKKYSETLKRDYTECYTWRDKALAEIIALKPVAVIVSSIIHYSEAKPLGNLIATLQKNDIQPIYIGDTPRLYSDVPKCLEGNSKDIRKCNLDLITKREGQKMSLRANLMRATVDNGGKAIDPMDWLCTDSVCPAVINNLPIYKDESHISYKTSSYLKLVMETTLISMIK